MNATDVSLMMLLTIPILPVTGLMFAATPFLMRRGEIFAVTVPAKAQSDPYLKGLKRRYAATLAALTVVLTAVGAACALADNFGGVFITLIAGSLGLCVVGYGLMLFFRSKVQVYKRTQNWTFDVQEAVAVVGEQPLPKAVSLKWNLLYLPILAITLAVGFAGYAHMPDMIPTHVDIDGTINGWTEKTPLVPLMPVIIQAFFAVCMIFSHWMILRSKKWAEPGAPATSALAYGMFARAQSAFLVIGGLVLCAAMITMPLSFAGVMTIGQVAVPLMIAVILLCIGALVISVVYGQAGSRVFKRMQGSDTLLADDDEYWKFGVFYYNPHDPSLFLPERFGVGWATNWARPAVWAIVVGSLVLTVVFAVGATMLF